MRPEIEAAPQPADYGTELGLAIPVSVLGADRYIDEKLRCCRSDTIFGGGLSQLLQHFKDQKMGRLSLKGGY